MFNKNKKEQQKKNATTAKEKKLCISIEEARKNKARKKEMQNKPQKPNWIG